jgi:hypothetical protein
VFESGAILLYLAEKFGAFLPNRAARAHRVPVNWLFWQMGSAPYLGGGFGHFYAYAPVKIEYAIDRFAMEAKRQLDVLDRRLAEREYLAARSYTIADMAIWPWYGALVKGMLYGGGEFLDVQSYTHVNRWAELRSRRPAARARAHGQPHLGRSELASCTSATTRATSSTGRRTSSSLRGHRKGERYGCVADSGRRAILSARLPLPAPRGGGASGGCTGWLISRSRSLKASACTGSWRRSARGLR